ncbi:hypothetical protein V6N11_054357 [Hibiscus sabdariffa]|uniref:non-specific serine/threonine protein kinase n=1 Tax=Hibiscus sabdariffa TaxID=183260 RepID=A0ABR2S4I2_9ROSI
MVVKKRRSQGENEQGTSSRRCKRPDKQEKLDFSCFSDLTYLKLTSFGIVGSIPPQIGLLLWLRIAFQDIIEVTNNFDFRYCIVTGGYGSVYRAHLPSEKIVALKKLHRREAEVSALDRSFKNKAKMLSEIRHKNIVKL